MDSKTINITLELNDINKNSIIQTLVGVVSDSEQKISKLAKEVSRLKVEKTSLEESCKKLVELEKSTQRLNGQIATLEKLNQRQENIIDKRNQDYGQLEQEKAAIIKERDTFNGQIKTLLEQLAGLEHLREDYTNQIKAFVSDKTALQKDIEVLNASLNKMKGEKSSIERELHNSNEKNVSLNNEIKGLTETVNNTISMQRQVVFDVLHEIYKLLQDECPNMQNEALKDFIMEICNKESQKNPGLKQILQSNENNPWESIITKADSSLAKLASLIWWSEQEDIYPIIKKQVHNIEKISVLFKSVLIPNINRFYQLGLELIEGKFDSKIEGYTRDEYGHSNFSKIFPEIELAKGVWCEITLIRRANSPGACYYY